MSLNEGDVIRFDYTLWADGEIALDTSLADRAKELGIERDDKAYRPLTITIGRRQIIPGLEKELLLMGVGETKTVDLAPEDAYGDRDPKKIRDVPMAQFRKEKVQPQVGMQLTYEGQNATITRVAGGRVRIDMNHDLAGRSLRYEVTLRDIITDRKEKVGAVVENLFAGGAPFTMDGDTLELEVPQQAMFDQNWMQAKFRVVNEIKVAAGEPLEVRLVEAYPAMPEPSSEEE